MLGDMKNEENNTKKWGGDPSRFINKISVEEDCLDLPYTQAILSRANGLPVEVIPSRSYPLFTSPYPESLQDGKRHLLLARNLGRFFKPCPATREYRCCDYQVLNIGMNCPMDCVYCILQAYLNNPHLSFFVNIDQMFDEINAAFAAEPDRFWRIGTGEFTDSMAIDRLTGLSPLLVKFMAKQKKAVLELKTKSAAIGHLAELDHQGRTIVAWSLNSPTVMAREELRTATLAERLAAAAQCAEWGYKLAFHFDPIIYHPDWQQGYSETIRQLYEAVPKEAIVWISMGALRFLPNLKKIAVKRFPNSRFFHEEFVIGLDNKSRYFRQLRVDLYRHLYDELQKRKADHTAVYCCMESDEIWQDVFGYKPEDKGGLAAILDRAATYDYSPIKK